MKYKNVFRDTLRLFGTSKLLWIFGAFTAGSEVIYRVSIYSIGKHPVSCIPYPLVLIAIYLSLVAKAGLIYSANQVMSNQTPTFSEAWGFCKTKVKKILGLYFVSIPLIMFTVFIPELIKMSEISAVLAGFTEMIATFFLSSLFTLSICAITINNLDSALALWIGLVIVFKNFLQVMVVSGIYLILQIFIMGAFGNTFFGILVFAPFTVTLALAYRAFVAKNSYPAIEISQPTA